MAKREGRRTDDGGASRAAVAPAPVVDADAVDARGDDTPRLDRLRRRVGASAAVSRVSVLRDLEAAKHLAFDKDNAAAAARMIELQGRIVGVFREPDESAVRRLSDEELIQQMSRGNAALAEWLRAELEAGGSPPASPGGAIVRVPDGNAWDRRGDHRDDLPSEG